MNALREVRDGVLRRSEVGHDFFKRLHGDYYGFSPEVCRLMARSPELLELVRVQFVVPLTAALDLLRAHAIERVDADALGARFEAQVRAAPELSALSSMELERGRAVLSGSWVPGAEFERALGMLLLERAWPSAYVRWALLDPIATLLGALAWRLEGLSTRRIGLALADRFDEWTAGMPLTPVWATLSTYALNEELTFLETTLLRSAEARRRFGGRLAATLCGDKARLVGERLGALQS